MNNLKIVVWKWDSGIHPKKDIRFSEDHVNIMKNMIDRNTTIPYEFVCITDKPRNIQSDIRIIPLWDDYRDMGGCFTRLKCFSKNMKDIIGNRFISIDLDCVILKNIDHILSRDEDFVIWEPGGRQVKYCGSLFMMNAGTREVVLKSFDRSKFKPSRYKQGKPIYAQGTDQYHISRTLSNEAVFNSNDGIYNFREDILPQNINIFGVENVIKRKKMTLEKIKKDEYYYQTLVDKKRGKKIDLEQYKNNLKILSYKKNEMLKKINILEERNEERKVTKRNLQSNKLPENASIIFFNGKHDPSQKELQEAYPWIKENWR